MRGDFLGRTGSFLVKHVRCYTAAVNPEKVASIFDTLTNMGTFEYLIQDSRLNLRVL